MHRAALAPFLANKTAAPNSYKWILYGDDDTFWFIDNVLIHLDQLDPDMPYLLSDNIWMKERASGNVNAAELSCTFYIHCVCSALDSQGRRLQALAMSDILRSAQENHFVSELM